MWAANVFMQLVGLWTAQTPPHVQLIFHAKLVGIQKLAARVRYARVEEALLWCSFPGLDAGILGHALDKSLARQLT